jgi:hypothetical protein
VTRLLAVLFLAVLVCPLLGAASAAPVPYPLFAKPRPLNRIVEDPYRGAIWLGSNVGLVLLQGGAPPQQFSFRQGLPGNNVYDIAPTPDRVWVSTNVGPAVFDKADSSIHAILGPDGAPIQDESRSVYVEPSGTVWFGTNHAGLFRVDPATLRATEVDNPVNHSRFTNPVLGIGSDGQEMFVTATGYGLVDWHRDSGQATLYNTHLLNDRPLYGRLLVTPDRVWVSTSGDGVVYLDRATRIMGENASPKTSNARNVGGLAQAGQETWFATESGVSRRDGATDSWRNWQNMPYGNANDVALVQGSIYAAMNRGFVIYYDRAHDQWLNVPWWTPQTSPEQNTIAGCDTLDGKLLVGTGGGGALTWDPQTHEWQTIGVPGRGPPDILVWNTAQDGDRTWFATQHGAGIWDRVHDTWTYMRTDGRYNKTVANSVRQVAPTPDGAWFATKSFQPPPLYKLPWQRGSLSHWDRATGQWTIYNRTTGLASDNVTRVELSPGKVWAGETPGNIDVVDLATRLVFHAYPTDGSQDNIYDMMVQDGTLWFGSDKGLGKIDIETFTPSIVPGTGGRPVMSLAWSDGKVWAGTAGAGIFSFDPATGAKREYRAPGAFDIWAYCLMPFDGLMWVGTGDGVERLDPSTGTWYPQMGYYVLTGPPPPSRLVISTPTEGAQVPAGALLQVSGTAQGPPGFAVQVRVGSGPWVPVQGNATWQTQVQLENQTQETTLNARLVVGPAVQAQTARRLFLVGPDGGGPLGARHTPVLQADEGDRVTFTVTADADVTGAVLLTLPGNATALRLPLQGGDGNWTATSPPLEPAGEAHYRIELSSSRGGQVLPDPYGGYGAEYPLTIRPGGSVSAFAANPQCPGKFSPGGSATVSLTLQNTGARAANLSIVLSGPGSLWATAPPAQEVEPAGSLPVVIPVQAPTGAQSGTYKLDGTVMAGQASLDHFSCTFTLASRGFLGIPAPALGVALLALGLAARARRRSS